MPSVLSGIRCLVGRIILVAGTLLLCMGPGTVRGQPATIESVRERIDQTVNDVIGARAFAGSFWGIAIRDLRSGRRLFDHNADHLFTPASNQKLLTAVAALRRLGPEYRYDTGLYVDGAVRNGVLHGNLIVRGSGDPTLGGYRQRRDPTQVFRQWADSLEAAGITRIEGAIIGDDDPFSDEPLGEGWAWNDVPYNYAAEINGLVVNVNTVDFEVTGRQPGEPAEIDWRPLNTDFIRVVNETRTVPRDSSSDEEYDRPFSENTFRVQSRLHPGEVQEEALTVTDPTKYFTHLFREVLLREGISVGGQGADIDQMPIKPNYTADSMRRIATYRSPPLREIIRTMNHQSQNLYAEQLLRTLAIVNRPDTLSDELSVGSAPLGALAVKTELSAMGVDTSQVQVADGSGLSRKNLVTPRGMATVLEHMWVEAPPSESSAFHESLPTGGEEGTLEYRFRTGPAAGGVRAKTGTLTGVSALSGYVNTGGGRPLSFVVICNHHLADTDEVRAAQDAIVNALAGYDY